MPFVLLQNRSHSALVAREPFRIRKKVLTLGPPRSVIFI